MNSSSRYNTIGVGYNTTRKADPYLLSRILDLLNLPVGSEILDIGSGTGNYTIALQRSGMRMTGVEPSEEMLSKARARNTDVNWIQGTAEDLSLGRKFDGVVATLTLHHWSNPGKGIQRIREHLQPGAPFVILSSSPEQMETYWLNHYFPTMIADSARQLPTLSHMTDVLSSAGFRSIESEKYFVRRDLQDQFLQCGKEQPELYFREDIRRGISSFQLFGYRDEVEEGLRQLRSDIDSGAWESVAESYQSDMGDYIFFAAR